MERVTYRLTKRGVDLVIGAIGFLLAAPLMLVVVTLIRFDSAGPALFRQQRVGLDGMTFTMVKFRTMTSDNDPSIHREYYRRLVDGVAETQESDDGDPLYLLDDPRVTRVGRWLRQTSLDELPNLWNVLRGEMSLVGPRPPIPYEVEMYDERARGRLLVKPGMTGMAQVCGRGSLSFEEIINLDLAYVERASTLLDLTLMLKTVPAVFKRRGV